MEDNLVGYVLDCLDDRTRREVEAYLLTSPAARQHVARLRQALQPLAADMEADSPPPGLVVRTLIKVAEHICAENEMPRAPTLTFEAPVIRRWWRRLDVLVAACLLLTLGGALLPALLHLRSSSAVVLCQNNLRQFFWALQAYGDQHPEHSYPDIEKLPEPRNVAGMVVPILADAGVLPDTASIRCPGNGEHLACPLKLAELAAMDGAEFQKHAPLLSHSYAYSLGYRDEAGYHCPGPNPQLPNSLVPIMGDRAPAEDASCNSANHGGTGQNILYADGHVYFRVSRTLAGDDLYLNAVNQVAAGLGANDAVLGASAARP
jgi:prepilin-type processing-associated H-X9-DG protein